MIARRKTKHGSGLGRRRRVVELTFAHLHNFRQPLLNGGDRHGRIRAHDQVQRLTVCPLLTWYIRVRDLAIAVGLMLPLLFS